MTRHLRAACHAALLLMSTACIFDRAPREIIHCSQHNHVACVSNDCSFLFIFLKKTCRKIMNPEADVCRIAGGECRDAYCVALNLRKWYQRLSTKEVSRSKTWVDTFISDVGTVQNDWICDIMIDSAIRSSACLLTFLAFTFHSNEVSFLWFRYSSGCRIQFLKLG